MKQVAEDSLAGRCSDGLYYVSKSWYDWKLCCILSFTLHQLSHNLNNDSALLLFFGAFHNIFCFRISFCVVIIVIFL